MTKLHHLMQRGTAFLGCETAIMCGAMSWVSERNLVSAISNAGGFGVIACGAMTPELLDGEIAATKAMTAKPFGVNQITMHPQIMDLIAVCAKHQVSHVVLAGGLPPKGSIEAIKDSSAKVLCFAPALTLAKKFSRSGVKDPQPPNAYGISRRYIMQAAEGCLRRLQTDYLDLFMIHRPWWDVALDETLRALDDLVRSGKVRYLGTSNYAAWELMEAQWAARELGTHRFVVEECAYNLLHRLPEREMIPYAQTHGTALA